MNDLKHIKSHISEGKYRYLAGILCLIIVDVLQLIIPKVIGTITDGLKAVSLTDMQILVYAAGIAAIAIGIAVFKFLWRFLILGVSKKIEAGLREQFYRHLQKLSASNYNDKKTGDLMAHATNDINNITTATGMGMTNALDFCFIPIAAVIMMACTSGWKLTILSFSPMILLFIIMLFFVKQMHARIFKMQEAYSRITETARENFSGIRVVKSFVQEMKEIEKFQKANNYNKQMNLKFVRLVSMMFPTIMSVSSIAFAVALWYGGIMVINNEITLGDFVAFNSYLTMLIWPLSAIGWVISMFQKASVSLQRINTILDERPEIADNGKLADISSIEGRIEFKNLTFTYPGSVKPVLKNINITIEKGRKLAIVGKTGSGKSTLLSLIPRIYNVSEGSICIDGIDIAGIPISVLRNSIGCVPQETFLFSTTIRKNIDFFMGRKEAEIEAAAKTAMIYHSIMEFPEKFDTEVGERGVTLSGGQKQRIAIARAILHSPSILILDDCLSAVDSKTEEEILDGLKKVMRHCTSIIVSHRISTIRDADEIIFLEDGEIKERGTHEALLQLQGAYYKLYQKQLLADRIEEEE